MDVSAKEGDAFENAAAATDITELYAPQFEQFGLQLSGKGAVFTGEVANDRAHGRAWIMPLSPTCIVMEHFITPTHNMQLAEYTPEPYACVERGQRAHAHVHARSRHNACEP